MTRNKGEHRQSRRFTIMLVPHNAAKVRSVHIPYWLPYSVISAVAIPLVCLIFSAVVLQARVVDLEYRLDQSLIYLGETLEEKNRIQETADTAGYLKLENAVVRAQLTDVEQKMAEIQVKSEAIDGMKRNIVGVFEELAALNVPLSLGELTLYEEAVPAGGPYIPLAGADDTFMELDAVLLNEVQDMQALAAYAEDAESYFRGWPAGWPTDIHKISAEFGYRRNPFTGNGFERHDGIDISVPSGSNVYATADGVVTYSEYNNGGYGYLVVVEHDHGYSTYYAHNSQNLVSKGEEVVRGQLIALSGNTGRSTGAHCHYEVRLNGTPKNPREYLN